MGEPKRKRVRTVEYKPGWGWIARNPWTGEECWPDFVWSTRSVARDVVEQYRRAGPPAAQRDMQEVGG